MTRAGADRSCVLITGGAGFIGANIACRLAREGHDIVIYDSLARPGVSDNLARLRTLLGERLSTVIADVRDAATLATAMQGAAIVYHLAAQVAVTTSLADPLQDFDVNLRGTMNVLEAARQQPHPPIVIFSSTNKVYGDLADLELTWTPRGYRPADGSQSERGIGEERPISFHTPYGCSKGAADQYVLDYARSFDLRTLVLRMSCIYGPWQRGTEDQGWVAHFILRALRDEQITIYGDGHQVRDILYVDDAVDAYVKAAATIERNSGQVFNLGGGPANAVSLRDLLAYMETRLQRPIRLAFDDWRRGDQRYFVTDIRAARRALELDAPTDWKTGTDRLITWLRSETEAVAAEAAQ